MAGAETGEVSASVVMMFAPSRGEGIDLMDDIRGVAVVFGGGNDGEAAVASSEDDDGNHQRGSEAEGEGVSIVEGH